MYQIKKLLAILVCIQQADATLFAPYRSDHFPKPTEAEKKMYQLNHACDVNENIKPVKSKCYDCTTEVVNGKTLWKNKGKGKMFDVFTVQRPQLCADGPFVQKNGGQTCCCGECNLKHY